MFALGTVADVETDEEKRYRSSDLEADITGPDRFLARRACADRQHEGDSVTIEVPGGIREYEVVEVSYKA